LGLEASSKTRHAFHASTERSVVDDIHVLRTDNHRNVGSVLSILIDAAEEWMFAASYGDHPDDRKYLDEDAKRPDAVAASHADSQGPHEAPVRAGEERILVWTPTLAAGQYTVRARLIYDLNRYNDPQFTGDQTEIYRASLDIDIKE